MRMPTLACTLVVLSVCVFSPATSWAQEEPDLYVMAQVGPPVPLPPRTVDYALGFAELANALTEQGLFWRVGVAAGAERPGDEPESVIQPTTSRGLFYWRPGGLPSFTNGWQRWAYDSSGGLIAWEGPDVDPPRPVPVAAAAPASPRAAPSSPLIECIIRGESGGDPRAVNRRSGASGLGQFLGSTWLTTPQGKAGLSVFDPVANRQAIAWMISVGRTNEFVAAWSCRR